MAMHAVINLLAGAAMASAAHKFATETALPMLGAAIVDAAHPSAIKIGPAKVLEGTNASMGAWTWEAPWAPMTAATRDWTYSPHDFEHSMSITALVSVHGESAPSGTLGAFVGSSVRGLAGPTVVPFGPFKGQSLFLLMIHAEAEEDGKKLTFRYTRRHLQVSENDESGKRLEMTVAVPLGEDITLSTGVEGGLHFGIDDIIGDAIEPHVLGTDSCAAR